jgi:hypothetical protein
MVKTGFHGEIGVSGGSASSVASGPPNRKKSLSGRVCGYRAKKSA